MVRGMDMDQYHAICVANKQLINCSDVTKAYRILLKAGNGTEFNALFKKYNITFSVNGKPYKLNDSEAQDVIDLFEDKRAAVRPASVTARAPVAPIAPVMPQVHVVRSVGHAMSCQTETHHMNTNVTQTEAADIKNNSCQTQAAAVNHGGCQTEATTVNHGGCQTEVAATNHSDCQTEATAVANGSCQTDAPVETPQHANGMAAEFQAHIAKGADSIQKVLEHATMVMEHRNQERARSAEAIAKCNQDLEEQRSANETLRLVAEGLEITNGHLSETNASQEKRITDLEECLTGTRIKNENLKQQLDKSKYADIDFASLKSKLEVTEKNLREQSEARVAAEQELHVMGQEIHEHLSKMDQVYIDKLPGALLSVETRWNTYCTAADDALVSLQHVEMERDDAAAAVELARTKEVALVEENAALSQKIAEVESAKAVADQEILTLRTEFEAFKAQIECDTRTSNGSARSFIPADSTAGAWDGGEFCGDL